MESLVRHDGGCHCGAVRFHFMAPPILTVTKCNCSVCTKKQMSHVTVLKNRFHLTSGQDQLTCYSFNTKVAQHLFCKICGVQSFYVPRSDPDDYSVMSHCLDQGSVQGYIHRTFDGENWEKAFSASNMQPLSKE